MNKTLVTVLIDLAVPAFALVVIAIESHLTPQIPPGEPECFVAVRPNPNPAALDPTRKARLNSSFKKR
jgi:hypothetical protein